MIVMIDGDPELVSISDGRRTSDMDWSGGGGGSCVNKPLAETDRGCCKRSTTALHAIDGVTINACKCLSSNVTQSSIHLSAAVQLYSRTATVMESVELEEQCCQTILYGEIGDVVKISNARDIEMYIFIYNSRHPM